MVTIVGKDTLTLKRDLKNIFPKEFSNRGLLNQFITYILNNFFEQSKEKLVNAFVGQVIPDVDGVACYISEPTIERKLNQIIPVIKSSESSNDIITYNKFINGLNSEGCQISNEDKLLSGKFWSWCPPINVDMFINYNKYYWLTHDKDDKNFIILYKSLNVEDEIIGKESYEYYELDENGKKIPSSIHNFEHGQRYVFMNDIENKYNNIPYIVQRKEDNTLTLEPVIMPLVVLNNKLNPMIDIIGKKEYRYVDEARNIDFKFVNGMRVYFCNEDILEEYKCKPFIISGVGESIKLVDDTYDANMESVYRTEDYILMERGSIDGNQWSTHNRWIHMSALKLFNTPSIDYTSIEGQIPLQHASMPIICFNKDMELYNFGTFDRGTVITETEMIPPELNGKSIYEVSDILSVSTSDLIDGNSILFTGNVGEYPRQIYEITVVGDSTNGTVTLHPKENGRPVKNEGDVGSTLVGDTVYILSSGKTKYYDGYKWKEGQTKKSANQDILFNLYDENGIILSNKVEYPNTTFNGCKIFGYKESTSEDVEVNKYIGKRLEEDEYELNYTFNNYIQSDKFEFTPPNDYKKEIIGYKYYKNIKSGELLNDWHINNEEFKQYLRTTFITSDESKFTNNTYTFELKYSVSETSNKNPLLIYVNGEFIPKATLLYEGEETKYLESVTSYALIGKTLKLFNVQRNDTIIIKMLTDDIVDSMDEEYIFETPLSISVNQLNENFETIKYNNCFDQMIEIIQNQVGFVGSPIGDNNYNSLKSDVSIGTKIVQHESSIVRTMILNNNTSIRSAISYASYSYAKFKNQFLNIVKEMALSNEIDDETIYSDSDLDLIIKNIIARINVGKEGLMPFYNNGVTYLVENAYIPSTPAFLGISNCYEPKESIVYTDYPKDTKFNVIVGHDGSYIKESSVMIENRLLYRLETLIYDSIQNNFKDKISGIVLQKYIPGKFRNSVYTRKEYLDTYSTFVEEWLLKNKLDVSDHTNFDFSDDNKNAWKTWNYTGTYTKDGEELKGSYRAVYKHYYDTHRPDTHPWEMLGFGDKPSWWDETYGEAPYTSGNIAMWMDIENGIIVNGESKGEYEEFKRPGLFEKYLPVDDNGNLKSPIEIGIIEQKPLLQNAKAKWSIGDIGDVEFAYMQTSEYRFTIQMVLYLLKPVEWVETNWDVNSNKTIFDSTSNKQIIDSTTKVRPTLSTEKMHNELIDGIYVRNVGIQQWISDYLISDNLNISSLANKIRNSKVNLGYRCAGFYKKDSINITTDSYGEIPTENIHINLYKSYNKGVKTYSGIVVEKTRNGYIIDGFDKSYPFFNVRIPEKFGRKSSVEENGKSVFYYNEWKDEIKTIPYRKEFFSEQDVYDVIIGYGKYLEDNEGWYFTTRIASGELSTFRISASTFLKWSTTQKGEDAIGNIVLLNPGTVGIGIYVDGMVDDLGKKINGQASVLDIYGKPLDKKDINVIRKSYNTYIEPKENKNIGMIKVKTFHMENLITFDNKTIFGDVLYDPRYSSVFERFKLSGIKIKNSYGDLYAPGYVLEEEGGVPNFDKKANDLQYIFDIDDVHCNGDYANYSKNIVGYTDTKTYKNLLVNDKTMFDFYKGAIREKGTRSFLKKMNRSKYISSAGTDVSLYENWAFKAGDFGHTRDNSIIELLLDTNKMTQNPQVITFENTVNYYYNEEKSYNIGDVVIHGNTEYKCIIPAINEEFNREKWQAIRIVGDYIIFNGDENWIKNKRIDLTNTFKYTNGYITNPIGGFPMIEDCDRIVFDESDFESDKDEISVGETIWIGKLNNGDWDVKKKTGNNRFVSMRYPTIRDLYEQKDYDYVYKITDNLTDYYAFYNSDNIEYSTQLYSDIDCTKPSLKYGDLKKPTYTGLTGKYVDGKKYKVKLYNTVFETTTDEDDITENSVLNEYNNSSATLQYSDLALNMTQFGSETYLYFYLFELKVVTEVKDVNVDINGYIYKNIENHDYKVKFMARAGSIINWKVSAFGCDSQSGKCEIPTDGTDALCNITVTMGYKTGAKLLTSNNGEARTYELPIKYPGEYLIKMVGGGAGGSGGSTKRSHKHGGNGGASGAYLCGTLIVKKDDIDNYKYYITVGEGGAGGKEGSPAGCHSEHGGDTKLFKKNCITDVCTDIAIAGGGKGIWGARDNNYEPVTSIYSGYGGKFEVVIEDEFTPNETESTDGGNGGRVRYDGPAAKSVYQSSSSYPYGAGGNGGERKSAGYAGYAGYAYAEFSGTTTNETDKESVTTTSNTIAATDSMEYSAYYQPYIFPDVYETTESTETSKKVYFYSYDVLYEDDKRPSASMVNDRTMFYKNRAKQITAYHTSAVIKNSYIPGNLYNIGDKVTVTRPTTSKTETSTYTFDKDANGNWNVKKNSNNTEINLGVISDSEFKEKYKNGTKTTTTENPDGCKITISTNYSTTESSPSDSDDKTKYVKKETITYTYVYVNQYFICLEKHIGPQEFDIAKWKECKPTYYVKITKNNGLDTDTKIENNLDYELYEDELCTTRVTKDNSGDVFMTVKDLNMEREPVVGSRYILVDSFATYGQLKPIFIQEPMWGSINNQTISYDMLSGGMTYYTKNNKETMEDETDNKLYLDINCATVAKGIKYDIETKKYSEDDLTYDSIINVITDNLETSYELSDGDIYFYAKEDVNELSDDTQLYNEETLETEAGLYKDYIPTWLKVKVEDDDEHKVLKYENIMKYPKYQPGLGYKNGNIVIFYTNESHTMLTAPVYYKIVENGEDKFIYYTPAFADENGKLTFNKGDADNGEIKLYDGNKKQITRDLFVNVEENTSSYYVRDYAADTITISSTKNKNKTTNSIDLYFHEQAVGKHISSSSIVEPLDTHEYLIFVYDDYTKDPVYIAGNEISESMRLHLDWSFDKALQEYIEKNVNSTYYVSENEIRNVFEKNGKFNDEALKSYSNINNHMCQILGTYRNENNDVKYIKLYMLGDKLFIKQEVLIDDTTNTEGNIALCVGNITDLSTYKKTESPIIKGDKIVNVIMYKEYGDHFYITKDNMNTIKSINLSGVKLMNDMSHILSKDGTKLNNNENGWLHVVYNDKEYLYDVVASERKRIAIDHIKSCNLVDNDNDGTIVKVQLFDPIQNIIPNNLINEIDYISSVDPVDNYTDGGKWNDQKIGYLWWDTSKVRYVDYHQGDYDYRRLNWGKQLPGSEIAIMEWTRSNEEPTDGRKYITRRVFNYETDTVETYYYYWVKNPVEIPNVPYRKTSALVISSIINNPTDEGIVWMAPIDGNIYDKNENTLIISNYNNVLSGQNAVLQINMDSDRDILDHTEWALVREHTNDDIPEYLWEKMKDSILGVRVDDNGNELPVPDPSLKGRQRLGLSIRPRQTMFKSIVDARENLIDVMNDIFATRDVDNISKDSNSNLINTIDTPRIEYIDTASSKLEMMQWRDIGLIGKYVLVEHDETLNNIWVIYRIDSFDNGEEGYTIIDYQKFNIERYIKYIDWYLDKNVKYITPMYTVSSTVDAVDTVRKLPEDTIVKFNDNNTGSWELWQNKNKDGILEPTLVGRSNQLIQIDSSIYDYVNKSLNNEKPYIHGITSDGVEFSLTEYEYIYNETQYLLEQLINYFDEYKK